MDGGIEIFLHQFRIYHSVLFRVYLNIMPIQFIIGYCKIKASVVTLSARLAAMFYF